MPSLPLITGLGLVTPLGLSVSSTWDALLAGRFITDHSRLEIPNPILPNQPRITDLALRAAQQAVAQSSWTPADLADAMLVIGTSKGSIESWLTPLQHMETTPCIVGGVNMCSVGGFGEVLMGELGIFGGVLVYSAACASGLHALIRATQLLLHNEAPRALVIAAEASVHPLFINSFQRLGVLAKPAIGCCPFDQKRDGFLMSDAAAAVCLELNHPQPLAAVEFTSMLGDATHITAADPAATTLKHCLSQVIKGTSVDLIQAHGTGTQSNDSLEIMALEAILPDGKPPILYSHKGSLGHSLGASGLVSVVLNCQSHRLGIVPPNIKTQNPLPLTRLTLSRSVVQQKIRRSLIIASGFGGATAAISLRS